MKISNLWFSFDNKTVFEDFSLETGEGITCLMGASGRGKTTLLKLVGGLLKPDKGTIDNGNKTVSFMFRRTDCCLG